MSKQLHRELPPESSPRLRDRRRQALLHVPVVIELSGSTAFRHTRHIHVPKKGGVYLIHDLRGVLYVGRTCNLYRRFDEHYWLTDNELLALAMRKSFGELNFSWVIVENKSEMADLENHLIAWLLPACNRLLPSANK